MPGLGNRSSRASALPFCCRLTDRCNKIINERTLVCFFCGETPKPNEDDECKKAEEIVRPLAKNCKLSSGAPFLIVFRG